MCKLEEYYISIYRTFVGFKDCNGYNCTVGGDGKAYLNLDEDEVIRVHIENEYVVKRTAEVFGCDPGSIQNILKKHNVKWLNTLEVIRKKFIDTYGGVVQMSYDCDKVLNIYDTPYDVYSTHEGYKEKTLRCTVNPNNKTHHAYGYTWYRLSELPEEYKPLLREYYASHLEEDNLEIADDLEYIYC